MEITLNHRAVTQKAIQDIPTFQPIRTSGLPLKGLCFKRSAHPACVKQIKDGFAAHVGRSDHIVLATRVACCNCLCRCHGDRLCAPHQFIGSNFSFHAFHCHVRLSHTNKLINVLMFDTRLCFLCSYCRQFGSEVTAMRIQQR